MSKKRIRFVLKDFIFFLLAVVSTVSIVNISTKISKVQLSLINISAQVSELESDTTSIKRDISVLKEDTGWDGWDNSKNSKKSTLRTCISDIGNFSSNRSEDYTTFVLLCIASYLSE